MYIQINHTTFLSTAEAFLMRHNDFSGMHPDGQKLSSMLLIEKLQGSFCFLQNSTCQPIITFDFMYQSVPSVTIPRATPGHLTKLLPGGGAGYLT